MTPGIRVRHWILSIYLTPFRLAVFCPIILPSHLIISIIPIASFSSLPGDWFRHRTGRLMICPCTPRPFPYELTGAAAKTATDAAVLRDAFRKHNYHLRNKSKNDDEFWNLSLSINEDENPPVSQDLINRLPTEILGQILSDVYRSTETSNDMCFCSRPNTPYKTTRLRSLVHRVVDTFAIRLTCSRWHSWALESILSENEHIELDISDLATLKNKMRFPVGGIGRRLAWDFPFLTVSGITLYLGNPGEVANLILVVEILGQEKFHGGEYHRIFRGLSFWDLGFIYRDVFPQAPWHAHDLLLLDIISHFSAMPLVTRVQFPATILAAVPYGYWAPVLEGLVRHSDRFSMREFLIINHAPRPTESLATMSPLFRPLHLRGIISIWRNSLRRDILPCRSILINIAASYIPASRLARKDIGNDFSIST